MQLRRRPCLRRRWLATTGRRVCENRGKCRGRWEGSVGCPFSVPACGHSLRRQERLCSRLLVPEDFYPLSTGPLIRHTVKKKRSFISHQSAPPGHALSGGSPISDLGTTQSPPRFGSSCHAAVTLEPCTRLPFLDSQRFAEMRWQRLGRELSLFPIQLQLRRDMQLRMYTHTSQAMAQPRLVGAPRPDVRLVFHLTLECIAIDTPSESAGLKF